MFELKKVQARRTMEKKDRKMQEIDEVRGRGREEGRGRAGPFFRRRAPHPGGGVQPSRWLGASQLPFFQLRDPPRPHRPLFDEKKA